MKLGRSAPQHRTHRNHHRQLHALRALRILAVLGAAVTVALTGCSEAVDGQAASPLTDPFRVGGLPVEDGPTGPRPDAPPPEGQVENSDGGEIDELALSSLDDIAEFWQKYYGPPLQGTFKPVSPLVSYDSRDPASPRVCGRPTYKLVNAFYCFKSELIAWDRGVLLPTGVKYFGDMSVPAVLAHEYGHAVQREGELIADDAPVLVAEQQADCFAGAYMRWVAEGDSPRFTLNTADGLNMVLAAAITIRDPILGPDDTEMVEDGHGTAFERVSAFQMGFVSGTVACTEIDMDEIEQRRGDMPTSLQYDDNGGLETGELAITEDSVNALVNSLNNVFQPQQAPAVSFTSTDCSGEKRDSPASYCPDTNAIGINLPALQQIGVQADESDDTLIQGDNTAYSIVASRYALALQHERGLSLTSAQAALRTACLTGAAQRRLSEPPEDNADKNGVYLTAGDLDEAVTGLLVNGIAASDVNGDTVPAGFSRIDAFRAGVLNDDQACYARYP